MKFMALDYGLKRTGVAVSDPSGLMAFPRATIQMKGKDVFFAEVLELARAEGVEAFVVGLPLYGDGSDSETTRQVRNMAARLKRRTELPVFFMEEALSSYEAADRLAEGGKRGGREKEKLDKAAAAIILESFLSLPPGKRVPA